MMKISLQIAVLLIFCFPSLIGKSQITIDTFYVDKDAYVNSGNVNTNYGSDSLLKVYHDTATTVQVYRSFLHFDLSSIPNDVIIVSAKLKLVPYAVVDSVSHPIYVHRLDTTTWYEDSVTWSNKPNFTTSPVHSFTHSQTQNTLSQSLNIVNLVQFFVAYPFLNNGIQISLQDETQSNDCGIIYYSRDADSVQWRPSLEVQYIPRQQITGYVTHCSNGNNDGAIDISYSLGSTKYKNYWWYKHNVTSLSVVESGTTVSPSIVDASGLSPGLYLLVMRDTLYYTVGASENYVYYRWFLVGEEGDTTSLELFYGEPYSEEVTIQKNKDTRANPPDYANTNYNGSTAVTVSTVPPIAGTCYDASGLFKYQMDFDPSLNFDTALLALNYYTAFYRSATSTNAYYVRRVTEPWYERVVTWNTRPSVDSSYTYFVDKTYPAGNVYKRDTLDLSYFVDYWQQNPDSTFGIELANVDHNQSTSALRQYRTSAHGNIGSSGPKLRLSFTVKPKIETVFYDSLGTGDITINAPAGELPYTYLISTTDTLPELDSIWNYINGLIPLDSAEFFQGKSYDRNYEFKDLPIDQYFVAIYDNSGIKIYDGQVYLKPSLKLKDTTDAQIAGDTLKVYGATGFTTVVYYGEVSNDFTGGFECEIVSFGGDVVVGFNKWTDTEVANDGDFEYGVKIATTGAIRFLKSGTTLTTSTVSLGDKLRFINENGFVNLYKNGTLVYSSQLDANNRDHWKMETYLKSTNSKIIFKPWGNIKPKAPFVYTLPNCITGLGELEISPNTYFGFSLSSYNLINILTNQSFSNESINTSPITITDVPVGVYNLVAYYSNGSISLPPVTYTLYLGYPTEWTQEFHITETPINNIKVTTGQSSPATAVSANSIEGGADYWQKFDPLFFNSSFSLGYLNMSEVGGTQNDISVLVVQIFGMKILAVFSNTGIETLQTGLPYTQLTTGGVPVAIVMPSLSPILFTHDGGLMNLTYQNNSIVQFNSVLSADLNCDVEIYNQYGIANSVGSYCYAVNNYVAKTKPYLDGSYFPCKFHSISIQYTGEYNSSNLIFELTDESGTVISPTSYSLNVTDGTGQLKTNADNRYTIDLSNLSSGYYLLTVTNVKGEKHYIRIKN